MGLLGLTKGELVEEELERDSLPHEESEDEERVSLPPRDEEAERVRGLMGAGAEYWVKWGKLRLRVPGLT